MIYIIMCESAIAIEGGIQVTNPLVALRTASEGTFYELFLNIDFLQTSCGPKSPFVGIAEKFNGRKPLTKDEIEFVTRCTGGEVTYHQNNATISFPYPQTRDVNVNCKMDT